MTSQAIYRLENRSASGTKAVFLDGFFVVEKTQHLVTKIALCHQIVI